MTSEQQLAIARDIRKWLGPLRREDGTLDVSLVAAESTLRDRYGVPSWVAELDAPQDTMPAQGWLDSLADAFTPRPRQSDFALLPGPDAGNFPALREEHTMAPMEMGRVEMTADREDFDSASLKASTVAQFATMGGKAAREELERRGVNELVRLADEVRMAQEWHAQGARDAADLRSQIASVLRDAAEAIDPSQMAQAVLR